MEPVKCPDCETWWRGTEHRCGDYVAPLPYVPYIPTIYTQHCCICSSMNGYSSCSHTGGPTYCSMHSGQWITWTNTTWAPKIPYEITIGDPYVSTGSVKDTTRYVHMN